MKDPCELVAKKLKSIRNKKGLSQIQVAKIVGLSRVSIANIEIGNQKPNLQLVYKFAIAFRCSLNDILPKPEEVLDLESIKGKDKDFIINLLCRNEI